MLLFVKFSSIAELACILESVCTMYGNYHDSKQSALLCMSEDSLMS